MGSAGRFPMSLQLASQNMSEEQLIQDCKRSKSLPFLLYFVESNQTKLVLVQGADHWDFHLEQQSSTGGVHRTRVPAIGCLSVHAVATRISSSNCGQNLSSKNSNKIKIKNRTLLVALAPFESRCHLFLVANIAPSSTARSY